MVLVQVPTPDHKLARAFELPTLPAFDQILPSNVHAAERSSQPWAPASTNGSQVCLSHHGKKIPIAES